ncbi:uncharacterized protein METZ01_LOCUS410391, partial [marine metagenome]
MQLNVTPEVRWVIVLRLYDLLIRPDQVKQPCIIQRRLIADT